MLIEGRDRGLDQQLNYLPGDLHCPEHMLQSVEARHFCRIVEGPHHHVEGLCFDRNGDLYFACIFDGSIRKINMQTKELQMVYRNAEWAPTAVKIHRDGRLFITSIRGKMGIYAMESDGSNVTPIVPGWCVDDMVFDSKGGFYFTHYVGNVINPTGGVYYVDPAVKSITPILQKLAGPNGVALSTNEEILWITETGGGKLYRLDLVHPSHCSVPYRFTGFLGPDSCSIDEDDNLYVAMVLQGQVMVFNRYGYPIARITLPGRGAGRNLHSSHPMVRPDAKELYIISGDDNFDDGSNIWVAPSFAKGNKKSYQFL